jgi:hypothetical protein
MRVVAAKSSGARAHQMPTPTQLPEMGAGERSEYLGARKVSGGWAPEWRVAQGSEEQVDCGARGARRHGLRDGS